MHQMFRSKANTRARGFGSQLHGIEQLEHKQLFASLLGDTVAEPEPLLPANQFYLRQDAHGGDTLSQDGSDLLVINNGDGSDVHDNGAVTTYQYDDLSRLVSVSPAPDPPNSVADVFAFHHDIGQFDNIVPGTVTDDGSQVCSDPGFGIVQSG